MYENYTTVKHITDSNIAYFMLGYFPQDILFKSVTDYDAAVKKGFDIIVWERKNTGKVLVQEATGITAESDGKRKELIAWWNRYLNIN
jgi:hypothetical protein